MDYLALMKQPIQEELQTYSVRFHNSVSYKEGLLASALEHVRTRVGKQMRPILILLMAKNYGIVSDVTINAAVGLELLHTASLIHDDVVDESSIRRGQPSVNAEYNNKVAVLVGDYLLSTALHYIALTDNTTIAQLFANLGRTLASGEILQLSNSHADALSEEIYYQVIKQKTAALFEACSSIGALSAGASDEDIAQARLFGQNLGIIFQIRDDIFDYFDSKVVGKPTGKDMAEGKLTLPAIYALTHTNDPQMMQTAERVHQHSVTNSEINLLVEFSKNNGGISYAEQSMQLFSRQCESYISNNVSKPEIGSALRAYLQFVINRNS